MLNVGEKIYQCRSEKGYTQVQLAALSGIKQANLSNIEKGKRDLTVSSLLRIASALGVKPAQLIENTSEETSQLKLTRSVIEMIALVAVRPQTKASGEIRQTAELFRLILPEINPRGSSRKVHSAWTELRSRFSGAEIRGISQRIQDALQREK